MSLRAPAEMMWDYWDRVRRDKLEGKRVLGVVALKGASQPPGTIAAWGLHRPYVENRLAMLPDPDKWEIQEFEPEEPKT